MFYVYKGVQFLFLSRAYTQTHTRIYNCVIFDYLFKLVWFFSSFEWKAKVKHKFHTSFREDFISTNSCREISWVFCGRNFLRFNRNTCDCNVLTRTHTYTHMQNKWHTITIYSGMYVYRMWWILKLGLNHPK